MDIDPETIAYLVSLILGILSVFLGEKYVKYKQKAMAFAAALKVTADAIEDDKITPEEAKTIVDNWKSFIDEAKQLLNK